MEVTQPNPIACNSLGVALLERPAAGSGGVVAQRGKDVSQRRTGTIEPGNGAGPVHRTEECIAAFEAVLRINPRNAVARYNLGVLAEVKGLNEDAARRYRAGLEIDSDYWQAHLSLARVLAKLGDTEQAERHFAEAVRIHPAAAPPRAAMRSAGARRSAQGAPLK